MAVNSRHILHVRVRGRQIASCAKTDRRDLSPSPEHHLTARTLTPKSFRKLQVITICAGFMARGGKGRCALLTAGVGQRRGRSSERNKSGLAIVFPFPLFSMPELYSQRARK